MDRNNHQKNGNNSINSNVNANKFSKNHDVKYAQVNLCNQKEKDELEKKLNDLNKRLNDLNKEITKANEVQKSIDDIVWNITRERKKKKISQAALAQLIGTSPITISRMESYSYTQEGGNPSIKVLFSCLNALGLKIVIENND